MVATARDRREGGRVNVYLSPQAMERLEQAKVILFPTRKRTDGLVIEKALAALQRQIAEEQKSESTTPA